MSLRRSSGIEASSICSSPLCSSSSSKVTSMAALRASVLSRRRRSMALCLAVAIIQAPGLRGMPSMGQRSSATSRASSASSKSRTVPISEARMRSASRAKVSDITCCVVSIEVDIQTANELRSGGLKGVRPLSCLPTLLEFHDRANFNGPISSGGNAGSQGNRFVEVFAIHQVVATELLFRLGKWTIGCQGLAIAYTHGCRGVGRRQRLTTLHRSAFGHRLSKLIVGLVLGCQLFLAPLGMGNLILVDQQYV